MTIGERINEKRIQMGLSLRKLARLVGVTAPFISDIERGRRFASPHTLAKIGEQLIIRNLHELDTRQICQSCKMAYKESAGAINE